MSIVPLSLKRLSLAFAAASSLLACSANAQTTTLFEWSGNYVSAETPVPITSINTGITSGTYYATSNHTTSGIKLTADTPTFYGVFTLYSSMESAGLGHFAGYRLTKGNRFYLSPTINDTSLGDTQTVNLLYFKKEDFINGGNTATITLSEGSKLFVNSASSVGISNQRYTRAAVYALVNGEWGWYLSYNSVAGSTDYAYDLYSAKWAPYTVNTDYLVQVGAAMSLYDVTSDQFEDIGAIGIYTAHAGASGTGAGLSFISMSFVAAIPEASPKTAFYLGLGTTFLLYRLKKALPSR